MSKSLAFAALRVLARPRVTSRGISSLGFSWDLRKNWNDGFGGSGGGYSGDLWSCGETGDSSGLRKAATIVLM